MTKFILLLGLLALINKIHADCGDCSAVSYAACLDETSYEICLDGATKSGLTGECSSGTVCTELAGICKSSDENEATCEGSCNKCITDVPFACVSATEFVMCDPSTNEPSTAPFSCGDKKYCNIASFTTTPTAGDLCTPVCDSEPTCSESATTEDTAQNYTASCNGILTAGLYPNKSDTTCKTYVYCEKLDSKMYSIQYTCSSGYFDKTQKVCVATKPSYCT